MNPFQHGVMVSGKNFCPRPELLKTLINHIDSRQNCVVRGIRRVGKTSAVLEAVRERGSTGCIYINCWGKQDIHSLATAILEGFLIYQRHKGWSLEKIFRLFAHLRPKASIDPYSGVPSISVDLAKETFQEPRSLESVFDLLAHEDTRNPLLVIFDEFQTLLQFTDANAVLATVRGAIQLQPAVTYFYLGSVRHQMDDIFNNPDRPFYKSAASVVVTPIERHVYSHYLRGKFATGKREVTDEGMTAIFDTACDITGDVQQLCSELWNCTDPGAVIDPGAIAHGLERIHHAEHESNSRIIELLSPGQVRVLLGLARVGGQQPTSKEFLAASGIAQPSSVTKALTRLVDRGLVYRDAKEYRFFSPFFRTWLLTQEF